MNLEENNFYNNLIDISSKLNYYSSLPRLKILTECIENRLNETLAYYIQDITEKEEYLIEHRGYSLFQQVSSLQKKRIKESKEFFSAKTIKKQMEEEALKEEYSKELKEYDKDYDTENISKDDSSEDNEYINFDIDSDNEEIFEDD